MKPYRTRIRNYILKMLKGRVDVGSKIFGNRPSPVFISETPCVLVHFQEETNKIQTGDKYNPKVYERDLKVCVDILVTESINPDDPVNKNQDTEDRLDFLGEQVETTIAEDWILSRRLEGFNPNDSESEYLSLGISHEGTSSYNIDVDAERRIAGQRLTFSVPYDTPAHVKKKYRTFEEYKADIYEVKDGQTTEKILLSAEGEV